MSCGALTVELVVVLWVSLAMALLGRDPRAADSGYFTPLPTHILEEMGAEWIDSLQKTWGEGQRDVGFSQWPYLDEPSELREVVMGWRSAWQLLWCEGRPPGRSHPLPVEQGTARGCLQP